MWMSFIVYNITKYFFVNIVCVNILNALNNIKEKNTYLDYLISSLVSCWGSGVLGVVSSLAAFLRLVVVKSSEPC